VVAASRSVALATLRESLERVEPGGGEAASEHERHHEGAHGDRDDTGWQRGSIRWSCPVPANT